ncbi:uncharacterized protein LOC104905079 [Beta vulgaris subsp. vulgaris]|uniref:uncharacterized protein LOC104905079 n=1 Tax=Beta vulgaris subsp. vulgaris TaxID=3555 RepID=UPI00053FAE74|nr:uncharacterized protein LOC104905079 [Beta vulgaris subsp. vulgaris]
MDSILFQVAKQGDTNEFLTLLEEDPLALQKVALLPYADTPLHIATLAGRTNFVKVMLQQMPSFAWECNKDGFTPLHIACAAGYIEIVKEILKVSPDLCLIKDKGGRTPLHYAAIKGRVNVVDELISECPQAAWEVTANGETALHLAVLNSQFEVFKLLISNFKDPKLINHVDDYGNTIFQLAEATKQLQVLNLLRDHGITNIHHIVDFNDQAQDLNNMSAINISIENQTCSKEMKHEKVPQSPPGSSIQDHQSTYIEQQESKNYSLRRLVISKGVVPILAGILATSAYTQGLNPPPTLWNSDMKRHGSSCFLNMLHNFSLTQSVDQCPPATYYLYMSFNTASFYCAMFLVFLHHVPGFLHALLPASLVSSLFSYLVFLLSMFPDAPTFLIINSVALLVFGFICLLKVVVKKFTNWTLDHISKG